MNEDTYKKMLKQIDDKPYKNRIDIARRLRLMSDNNELSSIQKERIESERIALLLEPIIDRRIGFKLAGENGNKKFSTSELCYLLKRADESKNPIIQARYYHLNYI